MKLLSWNINGNWPYAKERMRAVWDTVSRLDPDFLLLQELTGRERLPGQYEWFTQENKGHPFLCAIGSKAPVAHCAEVKFPNTRMGRALLKVETEEGLLVMTSHLESLREYSNPRRTQAHIVTRRLLDYEGPAIFAGDTNLGEYDGFYLSEVLQDAWEVLGRPKDSEFSWDVKTNVTFQKQFKKPYPRMRFDRAWANESIEITGMSLVGTELIRKGLHPSDHYGLLVEFEIAR